jgi:hypothetical protein
LVAGSKPAEPTIKANSTSFGGDSLQKVAGSPSDLLQLRELLQILLGNKGEGHWSCGDLPANLLVTWLKKLE